MNIETQNSRSLFFSWKTEVSHSLPSSPSFNSLSVILISLPRFSLVKLKSATIAETHDHHIWQWCMVAAPKMVAAISRLSIHCYCFPAFFSFSNLALYVRLDIRLLFVLWGFGKQGLLFENGILIYSQKWDYGWISDMGFVDPWVFIYARFSRETRALTVSSHLHLWWIIFNPFFYIICWNVVFTLIYINFLM